MTPSEPWSCQFTLASRPASVPTTRRVVTQTLVAHDLPWLVDDVVLVASELATNAVTHARTPFTVTLGCTGHTVSLEVTDGSNSHPMRKHASPLDGTGRGLVIVERLSREWGVTGSRDGKAVWALFDGSPRSE